MKRKNVVARQLRDPRYRKQVVRSKKNKIKAKIQKRELKQELPFVFYNIEEWKSGYACEMRDFKNIGLTLESSAGICSASFV